MQTFLIARNSVQADRHRPSIRNSSPEALYWFTTGSKRTNRPPSA